MAATAVEGRARAPAPSAGVAAHLIAPVRAAGPGGVVYLATSERRAEEIGRALRQMASDIDVVVFPPWDCLPYDRASPSRASMGRRMAAVRRLIAPRDRACVWICSPEAMLQRTPPATVARDAVFEIGVGRPLDAPALQEFAARTGYLVHDPIDDPGEISSPAEVIDVFPPDAASPVRVARGADGVVTEIRRFDPATQRSAEGVAQIVLGAASEVVLADASIVRTPGCEHALAACYARLDAPLETLAGQPWFADADGEARLRDAHAQIRDAYEARLALAGFEGGCPPAPAALYLTEEELEAMLARLKPLAGAERLAATPKRAAANNPGRAFCETMRALTTQGRVVVVAGDARERRALSRALQRGGEPPLPEPTSWDAAVAAPPGDVVAAELDIDAGYEDADAAITVVAAADVLGGHLAAGRRDHASFGRVSELALGDVVIHEDHGLCVLRALERVAVDGREQDAVRLEFHGGATLLAGVGEFGRLWRYGAEPEAVRLDRLHTDGWNRRRVAISGELDRAAAHLVEAAAARQSSPGVVLDPPRRAYAKFAARFGHPETPDQAAAIGAVLHDLACGQAMDRLVCGDVGFGKTEVALRAAAAAAFAGGQVVVAAPTTVLARQHFLAFQRRFAGTGIEVAQLSRLTSAGDAKRAKAGLADGSVRIVVGTHAVAAAGIAFSDLALVIVDEEQRFGAEIKRRLHALAPHAHRLTLTATPIPRTLQLAMIGLQDVSVIATPPSRRRPIRTFIAPFDAATLTTALRREARRGGQSFLVTARIADVEPLLKQIAALAPELAVCVAHGGLPADEVDAAMVRFADGDGDLLVATSIIESGLDVPRANTMIVTHPERFGLAQLHQLRGRVGRGRVQGVAYLLTDPEVALAEGAAARLATLQSHERLGSGLAISTRDLDLRGAGELAGEEQSGHVQLIGADLHHELLTRAVRAAKGEVDRHAWTPEIGLNVEAILPENWVADPTMRVNLYARLARLDDGAEVHAFEEELEDRFGPAPEPARALLAAARLRVAARSAGVVRIDAGPRAVAFRFRDRAQAQVLPVPEGATWKDERLIWPQAPAPEARLGAIEAQLELWSRDCPPEPIDA